MLRFVSSVFRFVLCQRSFVSLSLVLVGIGSATAQKAPYSNTQAATFITATNAVLNGMASPNGAPSTAWFEWGENQVYTNTTPAVEVGAGTGVVRVSTAIEELFRCHTFDFRLVVSNEFGVVTGFNQSFITDGKVVAWGTSQNNNTSVTTNAVGAVGVSAGSTHCLALRNDGRIVAWGSVTTNIPSLGTNGVAIAAGDDFSLTLQSNGTVVAWGDNALGQTNVPADLTNIIAISAGERHSLALREDGTVYSWGDNGSGRTNVPVGLSNIVSVAAGREHSMALRDDGTVFGWGRSGRAEVPFGLTNVVSIAAGANHTLALRRDGTVCAWGINDKGQTNVPPAVTNATSVSAGYWHSVAVLRDGSMKGWGYAGSGITVPPLNSSNMIVLDAGDFMNVALISTRPTAVDQHYQGSANHDILIQLSGQDPGGQPVVFKIKSLPESGTLYQCSNGERGSVISSAETIISDSSGRLVFAPGQDEVGDPYTSFKYVATAGGIESAAATVAFNVTGLPMVATRPAVGITTTNATLNGMVVGNGFLTMAWFEWGVDQDFGFQSAPIQLSASPVTTNVTCVAEGFVAPQSVYFRVVASNSVGVAYGDTHKFVTVGKVVAWGRNDWGQTNVPVGITNAVAVAAGSSRSLILRNDGTLRIWGIENTIPMALSNVLSIACGYYSVMVIHSGGKLAAWGTLPGGLSAAIPTLTNVVAVAANPENTIVLRSDGTAKVWGSSGYGRTNVPPQATNLVAIAVGYQFLMGLRIDGTVHAWGNNTYRQTDVPPGLSNVVAISAGGNRAFALRKDGTLIGWGEKNLMLTNAPFASNIVKVATGEGANLAVSPDNNLLVWGANDFGQNVLPAELSKIDLISCGLYHNLIVAEARPVARSATNNVFVNSDTIIQLVAADANKDPLQLQITSLPTAGALYQYTAGGRGAPIVTPNALVSDPLGRVIFVPGQDEFSNGYAAFTFTADDNVQASNPGTVTLNVVLPSSPRFLSSTIGTNGNVEMVFQGQTNATYRVLGSTNLIEWEVLGNAETTSPGTFQFTHAGTTNSALMFYRATAP